ncbi:hypothetical protein [Hymenobacter sp. IS2118]|uniref:hypothetical protein n=1 Tax=Hymenobacter sp. IS2118 TaxID=1505605 RepID=UPI00090752E7|nr:hypothetical protein [Hymenobacter sp. IS2118]
MLPVPAYLAVVFIITTLLAVGLFGWAAGWPGRALVLLAGWLLVQGGLAYSGFYTHPVGWPPRFTLLLLPPVGLLAALFCTPRGRVWLGQLRLDRLTLLHVVRIPVELVLLGLYKADTVPQLMTFEGRNFDILAGLTAPVVYWVAFRQRRLGRRGLLLWNLLALGLLGNIVVNALLSAPSPFQRFAFGQPNVAILHFPFAWLPAVVVPLVLLAHLTAIRRLWSGGTFPETDASHAAAAATTAGCGPNR